jgi:hypothetical protein
MKFVIRFKKISTEAELTVQNRVFLQRRYGANTACERPRNTDKY